MTTTKTTTKTAIVLRAHHINGKTETTRAYFDEYNSKEIKRNMKAMFDNIKRNQFYKEIELVEEFQTVATIKKLFKTETKVIKCTEEVIAYKENK